MPALNIEYTDEELAAVREAARLGGKSVKAHVHDLSVSEAARRNFVTGAATFVTDHLAEFQDAFPEGQR
ncbi:hypothetical protein ACFZBU_43500 [Embleya sp. NPDC008237]|uniref:hypothetical protein n=1 Tax=Embleya sp. NPDC008237 TaxID=3363978 RepID=UPI0036E730E6